MGVQNGKKKLNCAFCCAFFCYKPSRLREHLFKHFAERPFECTNGHCTKTYTSNCHLQRHIKRVHYKKKPPRNFTCSWKNCCMTFPDQTALLRHGKTHKKELYECTKCDKTFLRLIHFKSHINKHNKVVQEVKPDPPPRPVYACDICGVKFKVKAVIKNHILRHLDQLNYKSREWCCPIDDCDRTYLYKRNLEYHIKLHHVQGLRIQYRNTQKTETSGFQCDLCSSIFKRKSTLKQHIMRHKELLHNKSIEWCCPFDNCSRSYLYKRNLNQHIKTYHKKAKYKCDIPGCTRSFVVKKRLNCHKEKHGIPLINSRPTAKTKENGRMSRWDMGVPKNSTAIAVCGVVLPNNMEQRITLNCLQPEEQKLVSQTLETVDDNRAKEVETEVQCSQPISNKCLVTTNQFYVILKHEEDFI